VRFKRIQETDTITATDGGVVCALLDGTNEPAFFLASLHEDASIELATAEDEATLLQREGMKRQGSVDMQQPAFRCFHKRPGVVILCREKERSHLAWRTTPGRPVQKSSNPRSLPCKRSFNSCSAYRIRLDNHLRSIPEFQPRRIRHFPALCSPSKATQHLHNRCDEEPGIRQRWSDLSATSSTPLWSSTRSIQRSARAWSWPQVAPLLTHPVAIFAHWPTNNHIASNQLLHAAWQLCTIPHPIKNPSLLSFTDTSS
jgi:hypothetical protein